MIRTELITKFDDQYEIGGSLCQSPSFVKNICNSFDFEPLFGVAYNHDGSLANLLPGAVISSKIFGSKYISIPFDANYGDVLYPNDKATAGPIYDKLLEYSKVRKLQYIELRTQTRNEHLNEYGFKENSIYLNTNIEIISQKENWRRLKENHKRAIKLAGRNELETELSYSFEDLKVFYRLLTANFQNFGTPIFPFNYLSNLWRQFSGSKKVFLIKASLKGKMISGILLFSHNDVVIYKYGAANQEYYNLRLYHSMIWRAIEYALAINARILNLGTTIKSNQGLLRFKRHFGGVNTPTYIYTLPINGNAPDFNEYFEGYKLYKCFWRKLPLPLTRLLGKIITGWIC